MRKRCANIIKIRIFLSRLHSLTNLTTNKEGAQTFSCRKAVYNPKAFIPHAASLGQAFAHCRIFSTAATRRCRARVSVPLLGVELSLPLPVIALVSHYLTNKLIGPRPLPVRFWFYPKPLLVAEPQKPK